MVAGEEDAAGLAAARVPQSIHETVYSRSSTAASESAKNRVEAFEGVSLAFDPGPATRSEAKPDVDDEAGQPQAADRGAKPVGSTSGPQTIRVPSVRNSVSDSTWSPKHAAAMMVLAVHVVGDRAADRHELRARGDGGEPAARQGTGR